MRAESVFWPMFAPWRICSMMSSSRAELGRVEDLDRQPALGAFADGLRPFLEAVVIGLLRPEHMIELERELLLRLRARCGAATAVAAAPASMVRLEMRIEASLVLRGRSGLSRVAG